MYLCIRLWSGEEYVDKVAGFQAYIWATSGKKINEQDKSRCLESAVGSSTPVSLPISISVVPCPPPGTPPKGVTATQKSPWMPVPAPSITMLLKVSLAKYLSFVGQIRTEQLLRVFPNKIELVITMCTVACLCFCCGSSGNQSHIEGKYNRFW